jgi:hypothetical protein
MEVSEFLTFVPRFSSPTNLASARRVFDKLDAHVRQFLDGAPWRPFQHTLGISGYEVEFDHSAAEFYALALALPNLPVETARRVKHYLAVELTNAPPYAESGFDRQAGRPRESYQVPASLRVGGRGQAKSVFGVYAFWAYAYYMGDTNEAARLVRDHWDRIKERIAPLLVADYRFDLARKDSNRGEARKLNGDLAGLLGCFRLAHWLGDRAFVQKTQPRLRQLLELRVNLERVNSHLLEKSNAATKGLHNYRLARYSHLVPEVGAALAKSSEGCGPKNLRIFREERNGWFLAFGDRLIGGENYTNPLQFPSDLFAGAALIEQLPAEALAGYIDVPWCPGDFSYLEKSVYTLWALAGRPWTKL